MSSYKYLKPLVSTKKTLGAIDKIDFPEFGLQDVPCKIDTGAETSALHCSKLKIIERNGRECVSFRLLLNERKVNFITANFHEKIVRSSSGHVDIRYTIKTKIIVCGRKINTEFTLANREKMKYPVLLGKSLLRGRFKVDVELEDISYKKKLLKQIIAEPVNELSELQESVQPKKYSPPKTETLS